MHMSTCGIVPLIHIATSGLRYPLTFKEQYNNSHLEFLRLLICMQCCAKVGHGSPSFAIGASINDVRKECGRKFQKCPGHTVMRVPYALMHYVPNIKLDAEFVVRLSHTNIRHLGNYAEKSKLIHRARGDTAGLLTSVVYLTCWRACLPPSTRGKYRISGIPRVQNLAIFRQPDDQK